VRLDAAGYGAWRGTTNREDRFRVFRAFWDKHHEFRGTLGAALHTEMQAHVFYKDTHRFESSLQAALFGNNIPTTVYRQLVADVRANLPTLHRYLRLRQRLMGVDTLRYEDLYAPILPSVERKYTPEQAEEIVLASVAPLGREYVAALTRGFRERWFDWMPSTGKTSGAYSTGAYGVHPYQLQSFNGLFEDVSTLAHEAGHTMHTYFSDKTQPYVNHDYATFVAEVASTLNEKLLLEDMLRREKDKETQLFLLGSYLDNLRTTLFRQTLFAEFELAIHERAERDETLTGENLSQLYLDLVRTYYGHDAGVCLVDERYAVEWGYIDHFFFNFYVFQYATSIVAGTSLANGILDEAKEKKGTAKRDAYLRMLSAGSSKYPIELLRDAGVDMTTSAPFQAAMREMNAVMDEIERLSR
jgi:oligoendopeptidase F